MSPVETMEVDSPVTEVEVEIAKKEVKDVDTTTTEGLVYFRFRASSTCGFSIKRI